MSGGILRGGSDYELQASIWYFPQVYKLNEQGKLLLMSPSMDCMDRSGELNFFR
jgi:gamma-glutamyl hercynylcysteine S-oxide synthase